MASTWVGGLAWTIVTYCAAQPQTLVGIFGSLPEEQRIPFAILVGIGGFTLYMIARLAKKEPCDAPADPAAE